MVIKNSETENFYLRVLSKTLYSNNTRTIIGVNKMILTDEAEEYFTNCKRIQIPSSFPLKKPNPFIHRGIAIRCDDDQFDTLVEIAIHEMLHAVNSRLPMASLVRHVMELYLEEMSGENGFSTVFEDKDSFDGPMLRDYMLLLIEDLYMDLQNLIWNETLTLISYSCWELVLVDIKNGGVRV